MVCFAVGALGRPLAAREAMGAAGRPAPDRLIELTRGGVRCQGVDVDRYGSTVGWCEAGGVDLGGQLVAEGLARDYTRYSRGRYLAEEARARRSRLGM